MYMMKGVINPKYAMIGALAVTGLILWLVWNAPAASVTGGSAGLLSCDEFDVNIDYLGPSWTADSICGKADCAIEDIVYSVAIAGYTATCVCDCSCEGGSAGSLVQPECDYQIAPFNDIADFLGICDKD